MKKSLFLFLLITITASYINAEDITRDPGGGKPIVVVPNPNDKPNGKPRMPAKVPFDCWSNNGYVSIISEYPIQPYVQIYTSDTEEIIVSTACASQEFVQYVDIEPQNTALTIEIQVGDKTYIGEFFY